MNPLRWYMHWLHTRWPAGKPEVLPVVDDEGGTNVPGLYVVGDLSGMPLLKLSVNGGVRVARRVAEELGDVRKSRHQPLRLAPEPAKLSGDLGDDSFSGGVGEVLDLAIVGGGAAGFAAAEEARRLGLNYLVFEASEPFATIVDFPRAKPIYTYPTELPLEGGLVFHDKSDVKEGLLDDLREQTVGRGVRWALGRATHVEQTPRGFDVMLSDALRQPAGIDLDEAAWTIGRRRVAARRVIVAIGRSGHHRRLGVPGEGLGKVHNRLHDPADFRGQRVLVVGGGDAALESAIALTRCGARVTLSYRRAEFNRPKPDNIEKLLRLAGQPDAPVAIESATDPRKSPSMPDGGGRGAHGSLTLRLSSHVQAILEDAVDLRLADGSVERVGNDVVFTMIGRDPPLTFFRKSGVNILGERDARWWATLVAMLLLFTFFYHWKKTGTWLPLAEVFESRRWFPQFLPEWLAGWGGDVTDPMNPLGTLRLSTGSPGFWFSLLYTGLIVVFGVRRIRRRRTPYVTWQTVALMAIQCVPLFLLPYLVLPWLGHLGAFDAGAGKAVADALFPLVDYDPQGREYWRAFGLVLAWPLFLWNVFTEQPMWTWLAISVVQTFVLIPLGIYFWGKGVYCGWICSCGAMAETLGDTHRHKMPHGPGWNRLNMIGQVFLLACLVILGLRIVSWSTGAAWISRWYTGLLQTQGHGGFLPVLNYTWFVDLMFAGIIGFGLYFNFSGRVWCRFACPLAALMHVYHRFGRFAILADKKRCISCNVCTSVCHQGIDVMSFANKGLPMLDPQCVRCSACVQSCPTDVLTFGQVDRDGNEVSRDPLWLASSPGRVAASRVTVNGKTQR